jgi:hypothetical protein
VTPVEIACDESGSEGENLIGGNTDVFAHASVLMPVEAAQNCILELRSRIRSPAEQYKANHLLRDKHRPTLTWFLGPSGPLLGHAHVHLIDKTYFAIARVVDLLIGEESPAVALYREGPHTFGPARWQAFLESCNDLMRIKNRQGMRTSIDSFFHQLKTLHPATPHIAEILAQLAQARPRAEFFRAQLAENYPLFPALDPFLPAILQTIRHWTRGGQTITIVHDRQTTLSESRITHLKETNPHLTSLTLIESALDPRIQVADFLAGTARKIASEELNNRGDPELTALLHPYVDPHSIWPDIRSWALLAPTDPGR